MKNPLWKQNNPWNQLIVILATIEGNADNFRTDVISKELFLFRLEDAMQQIKELHSFLHGDQQW